MNTSWAFSLLFRKRLTIIKNVKDRINLELLSVLIVKADMLEKLNVRSADVARVMATFGAGTYALLADVETKQKHD